MFGFQVDPPVEEIFGPASQISLINAVETDSIDLSSLPLGTPSSHVAVFAPEPKVRFLMNPQVTVKMQIH